MKCYIVKDLLPNYIDNLTSDEINPEIETHLKSCNDCRIVYEHMLSVSAPEAVSKDTEIHFLKKLKMIIHRKYAFVILLTCTVFIAFMVAAKNYDIPVPYNQEHMSAEIYHAASVTNPYGLTQWDDADLLDFETTKEVLSQDYRLIDLVRLVRKEGLPVNLLPHTAEQYTGMGQAVRVVYYCYTRTLWDKLFSNGKDEMSTQTTTGDIYGDSLYSENYKPQKREIYYLPVRNMDRLSGLSDEEFDAQKGDAILVWTGTI